MAKVMIDFINPETQRIKKVKLGPSWSMFFLSPIFGIPLFIRKMFGMGIAMFILTLIALTSFLILVILVGGSIAEVGYVPVNDEEFIEVFSVFLIFTCFLFIAQSYFAIFLAVRANRITAKNLYKTGWKILPVEDPAVLKHLRMAWEMPADAFCDKDDIFSLTDGSRYNSISGRRLKDGRVTAPKPTVFE